MINDQRIQIERLTEELKRANDQVKFLAEGGQLACTKCKKLSD